MISVALASYNGERFIDNQIASILSNLGPNDELVISDDRSSDATPAIVAHAMEKDSRIKLIQANENIGVIRNFERAIRNCKGDYIFLADQDDVWNKEKVSRVMQVFQDTNALCILHDVTIVDEFLNQVYPSFFKLRGVKKGLISNCVKNSFMGNAMAFRAEALKVILPFPRTIPMHDQWIGIVCEHYGKVEFLYEALGSYRRHSTNVTKMSHGSIESMLKKRTGLFIALITRFLAVRLNNGVEKL